MADEQLMQTYLPVILPFERHKFTVKQWLEQEAELYMALEDFNACLNCDGVVCKAVCNRFDSGYTSDEDGKTVVVYGYRKEKQWRAYYTPSHVNSKAQGKPSFVVRQCDDWQKRRMECRQVAALVAARRRSA